ncbi:uncharacterized protein LOC132740404 [Ruditapes philippinarum]|uniref:uncharacterized protein LOC132740404 n=1 Tax=Ruditapes philippinarum TaxID=129788 RepID=UPI00295BD2FC|nr:uncharacterized protein LOC132740404 [Ruditapes philippinarum]
MERHLQTNPSGKFVKVQFMPEMEAGSMNCPTQWLLLIGCGTTQKDLEKAVLEMVNHCEKMFITSVHVYCSKELPLSFGVQSVAIIDTVYNMPTDKYPSRLYKYLSNVTIVAGDKDGFSNIESRLLQQKSLLASFFGASREWRKESQSRPESSIKIKLVGEQMEDVNAVKKAIEDFISKSEWQLPNVAKQVKVQKEIEHSSEEQTEFVNKTKSFGQTKAVSQTGNVGQTKAVNQAGAVSQTNINSNTGAVQQNGAITEHEGTEKQQEHMESSEVSAELNQGIVDHLLKESFRKFYNTWKIQVEDVYSVKITENRGDGKLQMNVSGSFESILRFEEYLEENFPNLPKESLSEEMEYDDSHFKISDEEVTMQIPITKDEKTKLMMFYAEEIKHLTDKGFLSQLLTSSENTITLICKKDKEAYVKDRFYSFKEKVSQLQVKEIHFASLEVMKKVETLCLNKQTDSSIRYVNDEKEMQIEIMGLDLKALDELVKNVERVKAEVHEEYYSEKKTFYFKEVSVHIYCSDILKTDVDCIVSSGGRVEKCIDDVAGKTYAGKVEKWLRSSNLQLSECYTTGSGNLKRIKKVIRVNCSILAGDYSDYQGLHLIQESVENCLIEADKQGMKSVAFPFICSAVSGYGIDECAQQYIRAILVSGQKLKSVIEVHFVDKDSVEKVCKVFDGYFNMRKDNDKDLLVYGENIKYEIRNTAIKLCSGDIQLSIAHGIAIFVDKHLPLPSDNRLLNNLQAMEKTDFQKMMKRVREKDEIVIVQSKCRMMYDVVLAAFPDIKEEKRSKKCLHDTVEKILTKASDFGFISFAISLPETHKDGRITRPWIQEFCKALVDFLKSNKTSLKDVKIVGTCDKNMEAVSKALEFCRKERVLYGGSFYGTLV